MAEASSNLEMVKRIREQRPQEVTSRDRLTRVIEVLEGIMLAIVAITTAWCGYQATLWEARSTNQYAMASRLNVNQQQKTILAGQDRLYDIVTFNGWVDAKNANNSPLVKLYERRFRREYAVAFAAWRGLDPDHDPNAPPGPIFMPQYVNSNAIEADRLAREAEASFVAGVHSREIGDEYVLLTVFLATVLLLTAIGQHFRSVGPRTFVLAVALPLLLLSAYWAATFPRA
jgi:hypothetical protein